MAGQICYGAGAVFAEEQSAGEGKTRGVRAARVGLVSYLATEEPEERVRGIPRR